MPLGLFRRNRVVILLLLFTFRCFAGAVAEKDSCARPAPGAAIQPPPDVVSAAGKLDLQLSFDRAGDRYCYVSNGDLSPTIRVKPGDAVVIRLKNELTSDRAMPRGGCSHSTMSALSTNLHFHGLDIPPTCRQDDVLNTSVQPNEIFEYRFRIPKDQPPGLYWYHPHPHGYSEGQVLGGASGALIVQGIERAAPAVAGMPERLLILRDQPVPRQHTASGDAEDAIGKDISLNFVPIRFPLYLPAIVAVRPDEKEFWRVLNASADTYFNLQLMTIESGHRTARSLQVIALDGYPAAGARTAADLLIPPGGRAEFIVTTPPAGAFAQLVSRAYDTGKDGAKNPARVLANIVSRPDAPDLPTLASAPAAPVAKSEPLPLPRRRRTLYFSEDRQDLKDPSKPPLYFITVEGATPHVFDMHATKPDITVEQGSVEDWVIQNRAPEAHVFHIHQLHFQLVQRDGRNVDDPARRDTIDLPPWDGKSAYPAVTLRMDFRNPGIVGTFVYHCHILEHEDAGMMGSIRVVPRRK